MSHIISRKVPYQNRSRQQYLCCGIASGKMPGQDLIEYALMPGFGAVLRERLCPTPPTSIGTIFFFSRIVHDNDRATMIMYPPVVRYSAYQVLAEKSRIFNRAPQ